MTESFCSTKMMLLILAVILLIQIASPVLAQIPDALHSQNAAAPQTRADANGTQTGIGWKSLTLLGVVAGVIFIFQKVKPNQLSP